MSSPARPLATPAYGASSTRLASVLALGALIASAVACGGGASGGVEAEVLRRFETHDADPGTVIEPGSFDYSLEMLDLDLKDVVRELEIAFERRDARAFAGGLSEDVRGSMFDGIHTGSTGREEVRSGPSSRFADGRDAVAEELAAYFDHFDLIYDGFFKVKEYLGKVHTRRVHAKVKQDIRGKREDGSVHQEHVVWKMAFRRESDTALWEVDRIFLYSREQRNAPRSLFREVTTAAGLYRTEPPHCAINGLAGIQLVEDRTQFDYGGVSLYDVDQDGRLDILMPNAYGSFALFMNQGDGTFREEAEQRGIVGPGGCRGAVFGDLDNDGDPDLYVARAPFHHPSIPRNPGSLFENVGGGRFRDITSKAGVRVVGAFMTPVMLDYDLDGDLDLYVTNYGFGEVYETGGFNPYNSTNGLRNYLWRNDGGLQFTDVTAEAGLAKETYWSYAVSVVDWNRDRHPDIYVANDFGPNNFYVNRGDGTFEERSKELGVVDVGNGMGAAFVDYDNDARWDLYVTNMQSSTGQRVLRTASSLVDDEQMHYLWKLTLGNSMFRGREDGFSPSVAADLGIANCQWAWNGDFADFDADGDADLVVVNGYYSGVEAKDC